MKSKSKEDFLELCKKKDKDIFHFFFWNKVYMLHKGQIYFNKKKYGNYDSVKYKERDAFVKAAIIENKSHDDFLKDWERSDALIYFDPPYFQSFNGYYWDMKEKVNEDGTVKDQTTLWIDIKDLMKRGTPSILVTNYVSIIHYLFAEYFIKVYGKRYQWENIKRKTKKTQHAIYRNF